MHVYHLLVCCRICCCRTLFYHPHLVNLGYRFGSTGSDQNWKQLKDVKSLVFVKMKSMELVPQGCSAVVGKKSTPGCLYGNLRTFWDAKNLTNYVIFVWFDSHFEASIQPRSTGDCRRSSCAALLGAAALPRGELDAEPRDPRDGDFRKLKVGNIQKYDMKYAEDQKIQEVLRFWDEKRYFQKMIEYGIRMTIESWGSFLCNWAEGPKGLFWSGGSLQCLYGSFLVMRCHESW